MAQVTVEAQYIADTAQYVKALRTAAQATEALANQIPGQVKAQDQMAQSTKALGKQAEEASKGFTILRNAMGTALGVAAVNLFTNITGRFKAFAKASFDAAARVEELDIAMNSIGKATGLGADTIKEATNAIRDNGIELAAAQQIAIEFAQNQLDLASASKVARVAQDLAVIAGQNSTATTQLLTQAIITGNSMLLKSAGISRLASEGYAEYAKQIGKSVRQLSAQERQQAVTNLILQEGERVAGTYEGAMNAAGKVLRSFARIINDIQIEIGKILLNAFGPLIKSTYDLLKAFSKALRDGGALSGTLSMLSDSFQQLTEPLVQFIKNLTESVKSGEAMKNIGNAVEEVVPAILAMVESVRALGALYASVLIPALRALTPLLTAVANVIRPILELFTRLPEPIRMVIGLFILLQMAMKRSTAAAALFGMTWVQLQTKFVMAFVGMADAITAFELRWKAARVSSTAGMGLLATSAKLMAAGVSASFKAIGTAAKGLMASLGPIGWALIAATAAMEFFMGKSQATEYHVSNLKDQIDATTGALSEMGAAFIAGEFRENFSAQTLSELEQLGFGMADLVSAVEEGGAAFDLLISRVEGAKGEDLLGIFGQVTVRDTLLGMREMYVASAAAAEDSAAAQQAATLKTAKADYEAAQEMIRQKKIEAMERKAALAEMTEAERNHANFVANNAKQMERATSSAKAAIEGLTAATEAMTEAISAEATYDKARKSIKDLGESFKENGKKIKGYSDAALDNRAAIRDAASAYIEYANSLDDPIERQAALEEGQERITAAMEKAGIDPSKSKILQTMKEEAEQSGKTVDEFAKQRQLASQYGNDVGKNFIDGIIEELERGKSQVNTAGGDAVAGLPDAANSAIGARSPSREAMKVAKNFIDGLIVGIRENKRLAEMEVSDLGQGMLDAIEEKLDEFKEKMQGAANALANLGDLTGGLEAEFGLPTQIEGMFGEGASFSGILGGYRELSNAVQEMFAPMLDKEIVPKSVRRKNRALLNKAMGELKAYTEFAVARVKEREALQDRMRDLDNEYSDKVAAINQRYNDLDKAAAAELKNAEKYFSTLISNINKRYDALEAAAAANIKRIEDHYDQLIPTLESALKAATEAYDTENKVLEDLVKERDSFLDNLGKGFRSFLNNLKVDGDEVTRTVTRTTEKIVNGIKVLTQESFEETTGGGGFADALQGRLDSLRSFAANVRSLLSRGLDPTLVRDFVAAGVDSAGETVAALASGSDAQIAQINTAQAELGSLIESFQQESSAQWFDYGIAQQEAIVAPLQTAAEEAQVALDQARLARETELAAAQAHAEALRLNRQAELAQAQADRDAELERIRAYQEQLRVDRENELLLAKNAYDKERKEIEDRLNAIEIELADNAKNINTTFLNLRTKLLPKMKKFGENIVNGLIRGLSNREGALYAKARAIADRIRSEIALAFQFGSPSKVTTTMGEQIAQGLIVGMDNQMRNVAKTASELADRAMVPISMPNMAGIGGTAIAPSSVAARAAAAGGGGTVVNVTVNAGMGADGAEVGRQVVEAIRKYERRNGSVFVSAS